MDYFLDEPAITLDEPVITYIGIASGSHQAKISYSNGDRYIFDFSKDGNYVNVTYITPQREVKSLRRELNLLNECLNEIEEIPGINKKIQYAKSEVFVE